MASLTITLGVGRCSECNKRAPLSPVGPEFWWICGACKAAHPVRSAKWVERLMHPPTPWNDVLVVPFPGVPFGG